ncbi:5'-nucleotidase [Desulfitobacterium dichloroeliminans LMG P-21439]|uniref:5'-nucleotidase SurE n=1 Tax=Desulfitobacterium dichloroeliminans (strain LMG P-21439 / DCA1) TaxID=871963 RepID=L0F9A1_DESDL|nr:5'/3'-nucleotidase SurE [Desulfitobacterium dichloroeliminans]AGA69498.1 5'-nucleotidase [Desulfitobacterium dichloroeliminans LMG P-21439]
MHILLTNDDGYFAQGLQTLYSVLANEGYQLSIVAPDSQRSATGHSITLFEPLFITKHPLEHGTGYAVSGKPADCVKLAIQGDIIPRPDLVISGINNGPNLGTDVFYSGTVSAAMEGVLLGVPAIAVSLAAFSASDYKPAADFVAKILQEPNVFSSDLLNVNIPPLSENEWKGVRITKLGKAVYENVFEHRKAPYGKEYYWQAGTVSPEMDQETDLYAIHEGYISLTPMHSDLTDYKKLKQMREGLASFNFTNE